MLEYRGERVQILTNGVVLCCNRFIGRLKEWEHDEREFWDLIDVNPKRYPLYDHVLKTVTEKESVQEIGEYLDQYLKDFC